MEGNSEKCDFEMNCITR